jgi:hypothetical protein
MRHDAPFLVKRYAPMIGRPDSVRRVTVGHQAYTLEAALEFARLNLSATPWRAAGPVWIERRGRPATRRVKAGSR